MKKLKMLIEEVENNYEIKNNKNNGTGKILSVRYIIRVYVYGKSNNKISLLDIESEKLEELLEYTRELEEKYCNNKQV